MKQATRDWVRKAEEDYLAALDLARRRNRQLHNSVCFHCQQSESSNANSREDFHFSQVFKVISTMRSSSLRVAPVDA
jgi:hypothetical protein